MAYLYAILIIMMTLALESIDLTHRYNEETLALNKLTLRIPEGSFFGLLGPNGAGKTTLIDILTSLIHSKDARVKVFGLPLSDPSVPSLIGIVPQEFNFNVFQTVEQTLIYQAGFYGLTHKEVIPRINHLLNILNLENKRKARVSQLSGGMKRRLMIARALIHQPRLLILDEPTAGVDTLIRQDTWELLKDLNKKGMTILLTTHYLEEAEILCKELAFIQEGSILQQGSTEALLGHMSTKRLCIRTEQIIDPAILPKEWNIKQQQKHEIIFEVPETLTIEYAEKRLTEAKVTYRHIWEEPSSLEDIFVNLFQEKKNVR